MTNVEMEMQTKIAACIEAMNACNKCYVSSLKEYDLASLRESIKYNREAAEICSFAAAALSRGTVYEKEILSLVVKACEQCANECEKFKHIHCQSSVEACRRCAEVCSSMSMSV
ncbi:four-helix bundle copper-binding protein [Paenibacillus sp. Marseille-Q4541]|uniref:four-helix bundle copper-binding protein n=1 Tax=Paenibacillus sp. Marseille-Q4541 TaxID=2831522 RepID=UPI001BA8993A|nr:four-helix bundle copper-binding protein [Paenibacillus sp. Marseille-Q4541]